MLLICSAILLHLMCVIFGSILHIFERTEDAPLLKARMSWFCSAFESFTYEHTDVYVVQRIRRYRWTFIGHPVEFYWFTSTGRNSRQKPKTQPSLFFGIPLTRAVTWKIKKVLKVWQFSVCEKNGDDTAPHVFV